MPGSLQREAPKLAEFWVFRAMPTARRAEVASLQLRVTTKTLVWASPMVAAQGVNIRVNSLVFKRFGMT